MLNRTISVTSWHRQDERILDRKISAAIKPYSLSLCGMWPSCWNHILSNLQHKKVDYHEQTAPNWQWQSRRYVFHKKVRSNHTSELKSATDSKIFLSSVMDSLQLFDDSTNPKWDNFAFLHISRVRYVSRCWRTFFFEKSPSTAHCSCTQYTYVRRWEWSAGFSCCVYWTLFGFRCKSKCKISHKMPLESSSSWARREIGTFGSTYPLSLRVVIFEVEWLKRCCTGLTIIEPLQSLQSFFKSFPIAWLLEGLCAPP